MLLHSVFTTNAWWPPAQRPLFSTLFRCVSVSAHYYTSISSSKASHFVDEDCNDFLPWLEDKAGMEISYGLAIGKSLYGRSLYASQRIRAGDCVLKVPFSVQMAPDNLPPEISCLLGDDVGNVARVALLILLEQKLGQNSEWAPYISRLPKAEQLHSTVFWSYDELDMIQPSALYKETLRQKTQIEKDFMAIKMDCHPFLDDFQAITLQEFTYAYGLVTSRAWESSRGVSMIPFADFLNHDGTSEACVLSDELKQHSEVIADRDYAPGDQILIKYGKFSNATLLLDFGFTVSCNIHDQVHIELTIPNDDKVYAWKLELLDKFRVPSIKDVNEFTSHGNFFTIKEVQIGSKMGKGIPQSLRAFGRIVSSNSQREINDMVLEAAQNDGRLARYPLKNKNREIEAHQFLISKVSQLIEEHNAHIKLLRSTPPRLHEKGVRRRQLALDLLTGELRILKSASAWLKSYCLTLATE